ncbi:4-hydroxybenzoate 3-monooxygenase [Actinophytocola oryzae]|uniref:4-hydroxybenzoate 3-monooxygenase n=1 Tax=Actinophytocola oryzae TaxID=502181 RepID=UPI001FB987D1|nr:4-hydroxybenzoate 3-monooxygenase [Actinophytocola oryzae]
MIVGAGPAGLVLGNILRARGVDTLVLERNSREYVQNRARAGFLGVHSVRVLTEHGLAGGLLRAGRSHGTCVFRTGEGELTLYYGQLGRGESHVVYPQQDLVTDLVASYLDRGGELRFGVAVTDVDPATGTVRYRDSFGAGEVTGRFVAGCDGGHGVTRQAVPGRPATRDHGVSWLAVLAAAPQSMAAVTYALHDRGFAGHMARGPQVTRYYLQVQADDEPSAWTEERIWTALGERMRVGEYWPLRTGPVTERRIVHLRSAVASRLQHGRLFLAGDAASLISPSAAKGANLAIMAAEVLARGITDVLTRDDERVLAAYSRTCLPRIWRAQEFSHWMIELLHAPAGDDPDIGFRRSLRRARLDSLRDSRAHQDFFAENYVGI